MTSDQEPMNAAPFGAHSPVTPAPPGPTGAGHTPFPPAGGPHDPTGTAVAPPPHIPAPAAHPSMPAAAPAAPGGSGLHPGVMAGPDGTRVEIISENAYEAELMREDHTLPIAVLGIGALATILFSAMGVLAEGGLGGAVAACIGSIVMLVVATLINTGVGWVIAKIFAADFGDGPVMLLRFAAVTAGFSAALGGLTLVLGGLFALFFSLPILLILAIWIVGMDMLQAIIYTAALAMTNWLLAAFLLLAIASAVMA